MRTFNTLKNQGYHFEHNYGHGQQHLATVLALVMLLAFLVRSDSATLLRLVSPVMGGVGDESQTVGDAAESIPCSRF